MTTAHLLLLGFCLYATCGVSYGLAHADSFREPLDIAEHRIAMHDAPKLLRAATILGLFLVVLAIWPLAITFDALQVLYERTKKGPKT